MGKPASAYLATVFGLAFPIDNPALLRMHSRYVCASQIFCVAVCIYPSFAFSFSVILFHYAPKAGKSWTDETDAVVWVMALTTGAVLLLMDVKSIRDKRSPSKDKFDPDVWKLLSYPIFFFLFGSLASVIPGMRSLIKNSDIGITMIALLVVTYPWEVLKAFWDAMKEDDNAETENKLNALCSKVQDASTLASSLQESQNRIEEKVHDIDERLSRTVDDKSGISFLKSNSTYELKITMRRHRR